jgi:hypothetical protein
MEQRDGWPNAIAGHVLLARKQDRIDGLEAQLAEVYPLLQFFVDHAELWARPKPSEPQAPAEWAEGSELLMALVHLLRQENESLKDRLGGMERERQSLNLEREHLRRTTN